MGILWQRPELFLTSLTVAFYRSELVFFMGLPL